MATVTVQRSDRFPIGTSVGAYPAAGRHFGVPPSGSATETHAVGADGKLAFTTLAAGTAYVLYAEVAGEHRYVDLQDSNFTEPGTLQERISAKRVEVGAE